MLSPEGLAATAPWTHLTCPAGLPGLPPALDLALLAQKQMLLQQVALLDNMRAGFRPPPGLPPPQSLALVPGIVSSAPRSPAVTDVDLDPDCDSEPPVCESSVFGPGKRCAATSCWSSETCSTVDPTEDWPSPPPSPRLSECIGAPPGLGMPHENLAVDSCCGDAHCPSVGSAQHHLGLCRPCDFLARGVCQAGAQCQYCHLCTAADSKRWKIMRRKFARAEARAHASSPKSRGDRSSRKRTQ